MIKELLQEGFILKSKGYYKHAIEAFYKALEIDNTSSELMLEIADIYNKMGDEERALHYIEQVLDKTPTHIDALKLLKSIFESKSAWQEAEQTAKNIYCISNNPDDLAQIFEFLNKQGRFSEIFDYNFEETNSNILYELAYAKLHLNDPSQAEILINKALEADEENSKYLILKGKILFKSNKKDECAKILEQIDNKQNPEVLNLSGLVKQYQGRLKEALNDFLQAIKEDSTKDEYFYNCASTYFKMDDIKLAKKYYNLAISINPDNQNYHFALANLYYSEKHYKRALEELKYNFFEARLLKAIILYDTGYLALSRKELNELASIQPNNVIIKNYKTKIEEELSL